MQQTNADDETRAASSNAASARSRVGRLKLNAVKQELRRAELGFVAAKRFLRDLSAREAAGRIANALGRANVAVDDVEKGAAVHPAVDALIGVTTFHPATRPADFVQLAGKSVALAATILAECGYDSISYWGRTLRRLARAFARLQFGSAA